MPFLRNILALARVWALPTVWSNCLAGWWLGGAGHTESLPIVLLSGTLLYLGGSLLKDSFDSDYDRQHRPERPIPSGKFSETKVYRVGLVLLTIGALGLLWPAHLSGTHLTGTIGLCLVFFIVLHNTTHRWVPLGPVLTGICRFLLYLLGASVAMHGVGGTVIWCGLVLWIYTAGLGYIAASPPGPGPPRYWPVLLLLAPIGMALIMDAGEYRESGLLLSAVLAVWLLRSVRYVFWSTPRDLKRTIQGFAAGIIFVDWLATCPLNTAGALGTGQRQLSFAFLAFFAATLLLQRLETKRA